MDEKEKQILHDYVEKHLGKKLDATDKKIGGLQLILAVVITRLNRAGVLPVQAVKGELEEISTMFSGDPDCSEYARMARDMIQIIDMGSGKTPSL